MITQLPHRFREDQFRRYEKVIEQVVTSYPSANLFDPAPFRSTTFACRLRDAMSSLLTHHWATTVDVKRLSEIRSDITVSEVTGGKVYVSSRQNRDQSAVGEVVEADKAGFTIDDPNGCELRAFAVLYHYKRLTTPTIFTNLAPEMDALLTEFEQTYDVGLVKDGTTLTMA